jgi:predicted membrane protein
MEVSKRNKPMIASILTGLILVGIGAGFLLDSFGVFDFSWYAARWWPSLIIAMGFVQLLSGPTAWLGAVITMVIGTWLQLSVFDRVPDNFWSVFWPSILILIGIRIMLGKVGTPHNIDKRDALETVNVFSGSDIKNQSQNFEGGNVTAVFGGFNLDLRNAVISEKGAVINATAVFGGGDIIVPRDWKVIFSGMPLFGGWEDKTHYEGTDEKKVLKINGTIIFGGIEVKN